MNRPQRLADFAGDWRLAREIQDRKAGSTARFEGAAQILESGPAWIYRETGFLLLPGAAPIPAERTYQWCAVGDHIEVMFEDGRFFHGFPLGQAEARADHWCDPDQYDVAYSFAQWPRWSSRWTVLGPRKDYTSETWYARD